ncbi:MAG TPA: tRNA preQ1(34) S-adenosylmethionine ribosyltransferase-isomerase QueA [Candidatus Methylomirabilis sp.]|nr:tRNA preQ1(34) S-adenosylmethionine ribosyltransferase-isomerase QueA [Candidatus Methylomirabilis sp.]
MRLTDFDYELPPELIAHEPADRRDAARLLVLDRPTGRIQHQCFSDLPEFLRPGDLLIVNDTKVIPARLYGVFEDGKRVEILLVRPAGDSCWEALVKPAKPARVGRRLILAFGHLEVSVEAQGIHGRRILRLPVDVDLRAILRCYGVMPLPPYIKRSVQQLAPGAEKDAERLGARSAEFGADFERYQTVYAREEGAVAAPTAGLHFTPELLERIRGQGVLVHPVTLHVGPGTFQPVKVEEVSRHRMEPEHYSIPAETALAVEAAKQEGRRVIAVGTTSVRTLEHAAAKSNVVQVEEAETDLFITPGFRFQVVDALITNFHLPRSTLLMLVAAFAGPELIRRAYAEAIAEGYRFYSYGDAMLIL